MKISISYSLVTKHRSGSKKLYRFAANSLYPCFGDPDPTELGRVTGGGGKEVEGRGEGEEGEKEVKAKRAVMLMKISISFSLVTKHRSSNKKLYRFAAKPLYRCYGDPDPTESDRVTGVGGKEVEGGAEGEEGEKVKSRHADEDQHLLLVGYKTPVKQQEVISFRSQFLVSVFWRP